MFVNKKLKEKFEKEERLILKYSIDFLFEDILSFNPICGTTISELFLKAGNFFEEKIFSLLKELPILIWEIENISFGETGIIFIIKRYESDQEYERRKKQEEKERIQKLEKENRIKESEEVKRKKRYEFYLNLKKEFKGLSKEDVEYINKFSLL